MRAKIDKKRTGERIGYLMKVNHYDPCLLYTSPSPRD